MSERVTVVVSPRERFGAGLSTLDRLIERTAAPHRLITVDAGSPPWHQAALRERASQRGFELIRCDEALSPNAARNRGLARVTTEYTAFVDNDVWVEDGWLEALVRCADETGADVVAPLTLIGRPEDRVIHLAGGDLQREPSPQGVRLSEEHHLMGTRLDALPAPLERRPCDFAEFHCMLVRTAVFERLGPLDEALTTTPEHLDLALGVAATGGSVWFEPGARVTYRNQDPLTLADGLFFRQRWSTQRSRASLDHFRRKWRLAPDSPVFLSNGDFLDQHQGRVALPLPERARPGPAFDPRQHGYAQTPAQLLRQLERRGALAWEQQRVKRACDHAIDLFAGIHRACGKPFVCHTIGTASILVDHGAPEALVCAALLHAAYTHGRFGRAPVGATREKRRGLAARLGEDAEALVHHYTVFDWSGPVPRSDEARDRMPLEDAVVCLMRIANDLEERLDGALRYTQKPEPTLERWEPCWERLAARVGAERLYREYALARECGGEVPAELRTPMPYSFAVREGSRARVAFHESLGRLPKRRGPVRRWLRRLRRRR